MQFDSFSEFLNMGGYGFFVWLSFGITAAAMVAIVIESRLAQKRLVREILAEQARKDRIRGVKSPSSNREQQL
ncbi:heme exporter protein CcmD [Alteromonas sp. ASW11-36]|uniref:Heme exporter protein D n=1 Tax=Alteromonas arenosi TaxID=3055817 RepID=A0ABT7T2H6_9ALTE|nr:heme exporter protein CcmD [Alteromonas sp. ASW11-36]MDM7861959.1 heme exporter protein CcmD [Alteromonas sp. ASW11-36]